MPPVEYKKAQNGRIDGFNYVYKPSIALGLLTYPIGRLRDDIYKHNRWDVEVEAIPGAENAKLYVKPTDDPAAFSQGQLKILSREEGSSTEVETTYSYTDFQSAPDGVIQIADFTGTSKSKKFKIIVLEDFSVE
jgi:hypothetical protein